MPFLIALRRLHVREFHCAPQLCHERGLLLQRGLLPSRRAAEQHELPRAAPRCAVRAALGLLLPLLARAMLLEPQGGVARAGTLGRAALHALGTARRERRRDARHLGALGTCNCACRRGKGVWQAEQRLEPQARRLVHAHRNLALAEAVTRIGAARNQRLRHS
eukprot:5548629-Pleurochrysis_carterae.AAC.1